MNNKIRLSHFKKFRYSNINQLSDNTIKFKEKNFSSNYLHFANVNNMYDCSFNYIKTLPSFHIGYDYATDKLISIAEKHNLSFKKRLLEICCGHGNTLIRLSKRFGFKSLGVDLVKKQISECAKKIKKEKLEDLISVLNKNITDLYSSFDEKFDVIFSEDSFSHIPERKKLLEFCHRQLNNEGLLIFSDLIKTSKISNEELLKQCQAWCLYPIESLQSYLIKIKKTGLKVLEFKNKLGKELLSEHIKYDENHGDVNINMYFKIFSKHKNELINNWGENYFYFMKERLQSYNYIWDGKLDYVFFVLQK